MGLKTMRTGFALGILLIAASLAGCGKGDDAGTGPTNSLAVTRPILAVISVEEAASGDREGRVVVTGTLLAEGGEVRLCAALAESFPPQCGGASVLVRGLSYAGIDGVVTIEGVSWSDRPIRVEGVVSDGVLTVSENAQK